MQNSNCKNSTKDFIFIESNCAPKVNDGCFKFYVLYFISGRPLCSPSQ